MSAHCEMKGPRDRSLGSTSPDRTIQRINPLSGTTATIHTSSPLFTAAPSMVTKDPTSTRVLAPDPISRMTTRPRDRSQPMPLGPPPGLDWVGRGMLRRSELTFGSIGSARALPTDTPFPPPIQPVKEASTDPPLPPSSVQMVREVHVESPSSTPVARKVQGRRCHESSPSTISTVMADARLPSTSSSAVTNPSPPPPPLLPEGSSAHRSRAPSGLEEGIDLLSPGSISHPTATTTASSSSFSSPQWSASTVTAWRSKCLPWWWGGPRDGRVLTYLIPITTATPPRFTAVPVGSSSEVSQGGGLGERGSMPPGLVPVSLPTTTPPPSQSTPLQHQKRHAKSNLYKTELCKSFSETGECRYGERCQFAHGHGELLPIRRHPKYKTIPCRTYQERGSCPYDTRCTFIHEPWEAREEGGEEEEDEGEEDEMGVAEQEDGANGEGHGDHYDDPHACKTTTPPSSPSSMASSTPPSSPPRTPRTSITIEDPWPPSHPYRLPVFRHLAK